MCEFHHGGVLSPRLKHFPRLFIVKPRLKNVSPPRVEIAIQKITNLYNYRTPLLSTRLFSIYRVFLEVTCIYKQKGFGILLDVTGR